MIEQPSSLPQFAAIKPLLVNEVHSFNYVLRLAVWPVVLSELHSPMARLNDTDAIIGSNLC